MKNKIILPILAAAIPLVGGGCGTNAHYIQTGGNQSVVTIGAINIQDYIQAANTMTSELLASGALDKVANAARRARHQPHRQQHRPAD